MQLSSLIAGFTVALTLLSPGFAAEWTELAPLKKPRGEATTVLYDDQIYIFNGLGPLLQIETSIEKYDPANNSWSFVGEANVGVGSAVTHNGTVLIDDNVWIIGGRIGSHPGKVSDEVWIYNITTGQWGQGPGLPNPVAGGGAAVVNNKIYWFGGLDAQARCDVGYHYVYDLNNQSQGWSDISATAAMPSPRNHFSTVVLNGYIYAIGGQYGHDQCPTGSGLDTTLVHRFDPRTHSWERLNDLPNKQSHAEPSTFVHGGKIYTVGGKVRGNAVLRYNETHDSWDKVLDLPQALLAPASQIVDGVLYAIGGGAPLARFPTNKNYAIELGDLIDEPLMDESTGETANDTDTTQNDNNQQENDSETNSDSPVIVIEAEHYSSITANNTHNWVQRNESEASNRSAMHASPDIGTLKRDADSPLLTYNVNFREAGQYHMWVRGLGDTASNGEGKSDSLYVNINGVLPGTAGQIDHFPSLWSWTKSTRANKPAILNIPYAGEHTIYVWMREDGIALDKFLLTRDSQYVPNGNGPASSDTPQGNLAPVVDAGSDKTVVLGQIIQLNGAVEDDGLPADNLTYQWSVVSGDATLTQETELTTQVNVIESGIYQFSLSASDGELTVTDEVTIVVEEPTIEEEPAAVEPALDDPIVEQEPAIPEVDDQPVVIEVEQFIAQTGNDSHNWLESGLAGASGGRSLVALPDNGTLLRSPNGNPKLSYDVQFTQAGTYYVWLRGWGDTSTTRDGKSDSVYIGINGQFPSDDGEIGQFPAGWHWTQRTRQNAIATLQIPSAGNHTVNLWMREDGLALDKLILTLDSTYLPIGVGPTTGSNPSPATNTAPAVTTMANTSIEIGDALSLSGAASDDGLPSNVLTTNWRMVSGPELAVITDSTALTTPVYFADIGIYVFELVATDGELSTTDTVTVTVEDIVSTDVPATDVIIVEAEQYHGNNAAGGHQWVAVNRAGASGGTAMSATPNNGRLRRSAQDSPGLSYSVNFAEAGTYYLWIRGWGDTGVNGKGNDDSIHAGLNGELTASADEIEDFPNNWSWSQDTRGNHVATLNVPSAGIHTVNLWMREDGFVVDSLLLTQNVLYVPTGLASVATNADNIAPVVDVDMILSIEQGETLQLRGEASDDGLPGTGLTYQWSVLSGQQNVTIAEKSSLQTTATCELSSVL